jgi:hypothetical protein
MRYVGTPSRRSFTRASEYVISLTVLSCLRVCVVGGIFGGFPYSFTPPTQAHTCSSSPCLTPHHTNAHTFTCAHLNYFPERETQYHDPPTRTNTCGFITTNPTRARTHFFKPFLTFWSLAIALPLKPFLSKKQTHVCTYTHTNTPVQPAHHHEPEVGAAGDTAP